jgi:CRP-like cAMP-binding protein
MPALVHRMPSRAGQWSGFDVRSSPGRGFVKRTSNSHLEITQEEIGALSGISRQNANQCLKRLEKEGLLEYGGVTVLDIGRLRSYGE